MDYIQVGSSYILGKTLKFLFGVKKLKILFTFAAVIFLGAAITFASFFGAFSALARVTARSGFGTVLAFLAGFHAAIQGALAGLTARRAVLASSAGSLAAGVRWAAITVAAFSGAFSALARVTTGVRFRAVLALVTSFHAAIHGALARLTARRAVLASVARGIAAGVRWAAIAVAAFSGAFSTLARVATRFGLSTVLAFFAGFFAGIH